MKWKKEEGKKNKNLVNVVKAILTCMPLSPKKQAKQEQIDTPNDTQTWSVAMDKVPPRPRPPRPPRPLLLLPPPPPAAATATDLEKEVV